MNSIESIATHFYFTTAPHSLIWLVNFFYDDGSGRQHYNYQIWRSENKVEQGHTDKPFTVNAAKVLLIDHLDKILHDENSKKAAPDRGKGANSPAEGSLDAAP
jgi:hypothetical protein